jgi:hypothetical protein
VNARLDIQPGRLWSLWDMLKFEAARMGDLFANTTVYASLAQRAGDTTAATMFERELTSQLDLASALAGRYGLVESFAFIARFKSDISAFMGNDEMEHGLKNLLGLMKSEMEKRLFFSVEPELGNYYNFPASDIFKSSPSAFGQPVDDAFPNAKMDMIEAGNCLAVGRNNGAVYHLMCVAEVGLRTLAWDRKVIAKHNKQAVPLEFAQWGDLIGKLETEIEKIKKWRSKPTGAAAEQFYNSALVELRAFNSGWRTHVMHARSHVYKTDETIALFGHVKRFMELLATKISENARTPYVWKNPKKKA